MSHPGVDLLRSGVRWPFVFVRDTASCSVAVFVEGTWTIIAGSFTEETYVARTCMAVGPDCD